MKFQVGDTVFVLYDNKIRQTTVSCLRVVQNVKPRTADEAANIRTAIVPFGHDLEEYGLYCGVYSANNVFASREELIASL